MATSHQGTRHQNRKLTHADVVVCGGGVAGTMAAIAAARQGASVLLVERYGFLGGNATAGALWLAWPTRWSTDCAATALHASRDPYSSDAWFNISRLGIDAPDPLALGAAEIEDRRQAWKAAQFLQQAAPGCDQGQLRAFATQVGVRETRRTEGDHVLSAEELMRPEQFADAIAAGAYPIDIHPAAGGGLDYRRLVPLSFDNALVAGRGLSATHAALAAVRVMTISMAVGQAAGVAAAMAAAQAGRSRQAARMRAVDAAELRAALEKAGACLR